MLNNVVRPQANNLGLCLIRLILAAYLISLVKTLADWAMGGPVVGAVSLGLTILQTATVSFAEYDVRNGRRARGNLALVNLIWTSNNQCLRPF